MALSKDDFDFGPALIGPNTTRTCVCCEETIYEGHYAIWVTTTKGTKFFCEPCVPDLAGNQEAYEDVHRIDDNAEIPF
tara:strand:- start:7 stop:240 length:234 start_codon:yes stop_codon:yes gene_type:complete